MKISVVISYWAGRKPDSLLRLLRQVFGVEAGVPFSVTVVCNGGDQAGLVLPARYRDRVRVLNRANAGYNIGAWDYGWRNEPESDYFLFVQDECEVHRPGWLAAFVDKMQASPDIGLLGESLNWRCRWDVQRTNPKAVTCLNRDGEPPFNSVDFLRDFLVGLGIPPGESAEHLQSLVLFTSRDVLEQIDGFPQRDTYREAVGTEIAISKKVLACGYRIAMVGEQRFEYIRHRQWVDGWYKRWTMLKIRLRPYKARVEVWLQRVRP